MAGRRLSIVPSIGRADSKQPRTGVTGEPRRFWPLGPVLHKLLRSYALDLVFRFRSRYGLTCAQSPWLSHLSRLPSLQQASSCPISFTARVSLLQLCTASCARVMAEVVIVLVQAAAWSRSFFGSVRQFMFR